jgi:hypothetical protein
VRAIALDSGQRGHRRVPVPAEHAERVPGPAQSAMDGFEVFGGVAPIAERGQQFVQPPPAVRGTVGQRGAERIHVRTDIRDGVRDLFARPVRH